MALRLQRLGLGEAHQLLALCGEQEFTVGLTASLLAHGVGFTFRLIVWRCATTSACRRSCSACSTFALAIAAAVNSRPSTFK